MSDNAIVIRPEFAPGRRIIAISDIHGNLPFLQNLLRKIRFTKEDILILLGDMLEKGPDNLALASYIMDLCNTHTVYPICGNCDGLVLNFFRTDALDESFFARYLPNHPESCIFQMADRMGYTGDRWDFPALRAALNRGFPHLRDWLATRRSGPGCAACPPFWRPSTWSLSTAGSPPWSTWIASTAGSA